MNVIDILLVLIASCSVALGIRRGFSKAVFDFVALLIAVRTAPLVLPATASAVHLAKDAPMNETVWFVVIFAVISVGLIYLGKQIYGRMLFSTEVFEPMLGALVGIGIAVIVGHVLMRMLAVSAAVHGQPPAVLAQSTLGTEFYQFDTYHRVLDFMYRLGQ